MYIAVFKMRIDPDFKTEFDDLYPRMLKLVSDMDGFLGHKVYAADDGELVLIANFSDMATIEAWDEHPEHKYAKERGKMDIFTTYDVSVAKVTEHHSKP